MEQRADGVDPPVLRPGLALAVFPGAMYIPQRAFLRVGVEVGAERRTGAEGAIRVLGADDGAQPGGIGMGERERLAVRVHQLVAAAPDSQAGVVAPRSDDGAGVGVQTAQVD